MLSDSAFQVSGPAWENACSPNLVRRRDKVAFHDIDIDIVTNILARMSVSVSMLVSWNADYRSSPSVSPEGDLVVLTDCTASARYVGLRP